MVERSQTSERHNISFESENDIFTITRFYEDLLIQMGNENRIAGEFHTPRPVIRFMVEVIDPQIGETVYDPASGSQRAHGRYQYPTQRWLVWAKQYRLERLYEAHVEARGLHGATGD